MGYNQLISLKNSHVYPTLVMNSFKLAILYIFLNASPNASLMKWNRFFAIAALVFLFSLPVFAQQYKTEHVEFNGVKYPAYSKVVNVSEDQAIAAVREIFSSRGIQPKTMKGFLIYRNVVLPAIGNNDRNDLFIKVEREGKKNENQSKLYAIITRPGAISEDKPLKSEKGAASGVALAAGGAQLFEAVTPALENQEYLNSVLEQEEAVRKAEKKLKGLEEDSVRMNKQLTKLQEDLQKNSEERSKQVEELETAKRELEMRKNAKPKKVN